MGATKSQIPFTYADYKSLPESMDRRYELMDGELCLVPAPTTLHQFVSQNVEVLLVAHVRATRGGLVLHAPVDVVLGEGDRRDVLQPEGFAPAERYRSGDEIASAVVPDFRLPVDEVFKRWD
jgi:Uma2 family endonuclease